MPSQSEFYDPIEYHDRVVQKKPPLFAPVSLLPHMLCVGVKTPTKTVIFYNQDREIRDAPKGRYLP